jgi:uncharacterized cupin superfamily protein
MGEFSDSDAISDIRPSNFGSAKALSREIVTATPSTLELGPERVPITPSWVLGGRPLTRTKNVARSHDWTSNTVVWECTAGSFTWHYSKDEVAVIVSGEAVITNEKGEERRLAPGDLVFFPAGTSSRWRVPEGVRKIAILHEPMWRPLGLGLKVCKKLLRMAGIGAESPF